MHITATSLPDAINQWAQQTGFHVVWSEAASASAVVPQLDGNFTPRQALDRLLRNTHLQAEFPDPHTAVITPVESRAATGKGAPVRLADSGSGIRLASAGSESSPLDLVVVTAEKRTENIQDVPVPVSVLEPAALTQTNQALLKDYYASVPGLSVTPNIESSTILSIRGISTGNFTNPTVGVLVDDALYTSALNITFQIPDVDPGDLERIEVLRGPQGTLYGANSMGGLIKYVTVDPTSDHFSGRIEAGTSEVHNGAEPGFNLRGAVNIPLTDTLAIRASGFTRQDAGYIDNPFLHIRGINEAEAAGGRLAIMWRPSDDVSLKLSALDQNTRGNGLSDADKGPGLGDLQQNYVPGAGPYDGRLQAYSATLKAGMGGVNLTSVTAYNITNYHDSWDGSVFFGPGVLWTDQFKTTKFMQEVRLNGTAFSNLDWLVGGFFTHEHSSHSYDVMNVDPATGNFVSPLATGTLPISYDEYAGFADLTYHFTDRFDIQIGGRDSHIKVNNEPELSGTTVTAGAQSTANAFTYLFTPQYKINPDLMVYARLASGYRPGGPNLAYAVTTVGAPASFDPDRTYNYEIGAKGDFFDHLLSLDASVYYIDWKKIQLQLSIGNAGYNANGGSAKSQGVELSATLRPATGLKIAGWISYDDAVLTQDLPPESTVKGAKGDRLPNAARVTANLSLQQDFPLWGSATGFIGGQASYVGDREGLLVAAPPRQNYPAYTKTDVRAGFEQDAWAVTLYVNNVADQRGVINTVNFFPKAFIYIQPRTIGVTVSRRF
jgi:outer membrane receptor protein involved in Fe transport